MRQIDRFQPQKASKVRFQRRERWHGRKPRSFISFSAHLKAALRLKTRRISSSCSISTNCSWLWSDFTTSTDLILIKVVARRAMQACDQSMSTPEIGLRSLQSRIQGSRSMRIPMKVIPTRENLVFGGHPVDSPFSSFSLWEQSSTTTWTQAKNKTEDYLD